MPKEQAPLNHPVMTALQYARELATPVVPTQQELVHEWLGDEVELAAAQDLANYLQARPRTAKNVVTDEQLYHTTLAEQQNYDDFSLRQLALVGMVDYMFRDDKTSLEDTSDRINSRLKAAGVSEHGRRTVTARLYGEAWAIINARPLDESASGSTPAVHDYDPLTDPVSAEAIAAESPVIFDAMTRETGTETGAAEEEGRPSPHRLNATGAAVTGTGNRSERGKHKRHETSRRRRGALAVIGALAIAGAAMFLVSSDHSTSVRPGHVTETGTWNDHTGNMTSTPSATASHSATETATATATPTPKPVHTGGTTTPKVGSTPNLQPANIGTAEHLIPGGTIEGNVSAELAHTTYGNSAKNIDTVTRWILHNQQLTWAKAHYLLPGYSFDMPSQQVLDQLLKTN